LKYLVKVPEGCRQGTIDMLKDLLKLRMTTTVTENDEFLMNMVQNATIVFNAENYYRAMMIGNEDSWNVRDRHMTDTLDTIFKSLYPQGKCIIWAHNTHIGDYRYTDMIDEGQINIGGLARERYGENNVALVGFGTYSGSVIASHKWGGKIKKFPVPPGRPGSYDESNHKICQLLKAPGFSMIFKELSEKNRKQFLEKKGQRAIGVVYNPEHETFGNYVPTILGKRYDAFICVDKTTALKPITTAPPDEKEIPETFPSTV